MVEKDWKLLQRLKPLALERFCQRALDEIVQLAANSAQGSHARYLELYKLLHERDDQLASAFNDLRRSTAWARLARMRSLGVITDEEFAKFSAESREAVAAYF